MAVPVGHMSCGSLLKNLFAQSLSFSPPGMVEAPAGSVCSPGQSMVVQHEDSSICPAGKLLNQPQQWKEKHLVRAHPSWHPHNSSCPHYLESSCPPALLPLHTLGVVLDVVTCCLPAPALPPACREACGLPRPGHHPVPPAVSLLEAGTLPALGASDAAALLLYCHVP